MGNINWCDYVLNPVAGCSPCGTGCENCYSAQNAIRTSKNPKTAAKYNGVVNENGWTGKTGEIDLRFFDRLTQKPHTYLVGNMGDLFCEAIPENLIDRLLDRFRDFPQHTFIFLTRYPETMAKRLGGKKPQNLWIGVSACNQDEADKNVPVLLEIPATLHFVVVEPMLEAVVLPRMPEWVICGPETGKNRRDFSPQWAADLQKQCEDAEVPFFFNGDAYKTALSTKIRQYPNCP